MTITQTDNVLNGYEYDYDYDDKQLKLFFKDFIHLNTIDYYDTDLVSIYYHEEQESFYICLIWYGYDSDIFFSISNTDLISYLYGKLSLLDAINKANNIDYIHYHTCNVYYVNINFLDSNYLPSDKSYYNYKDFSTGDFFNNEWHSYIKCLL